MAPAVVLTRSPEDNEELAKLLEASGVEIVEYPCMRLEVVEASRVDGPVDAVAFTSRMGVRGFFQNRMDEGLQPRVVGAVGESTSRQVAECGWRTTHVPAVSTGDALAELLAGTLRAGERLLWPCGNRSSSSFSQILRSAGVEVLVRMVYLNVDSMPAPLDGACDAVVVASPSALHRFVLANPARLKVPFVAIGPRTADAAIEAGVALVFESPRPAAQDIATTVLRALGRGE